ncbi:efflux RND transporter periplasmic adaptor subunit [Rhodoferax sp.]|uniref:efflux RND transporter periplasmic adaptor subunit n=1 Tax=Rhodoferax sp. TaxID=50421 RepID=UPI00272F032F|nr:HlyD family efflux transporter periplasmic adaptor subunit [Rhodoferax sp.]MDP1527988.1 HlyD family efflux transporter periplasmic adaptor subunit [Rhodoferax sp.]MDP1942657.1 HlyD family efflux transporter periplasmic adaptor subunit [Rhodoferax sp.]MDP2439956.1 HlyD family efflux transporter periplasmic adaptor subunit [Rhodoferax sp.]MDP3865618.1 HlyD family efflux transporter periplasmic adaptor subunit [Rhodoferax sp.]MDZ4207152.1 HlyD family efflux transporter periplasmic adaptor subu
MNNTNPSKKYRRWLGGALLLAAAAALVWAVYRPRPLLVEVAPVSLGNFEQSIEEDGRLRLKNRYVITAPTQAELLRPTLKVGDPVRAGEVVATLVPVAPQMIDARSRSVLQQRVGSAEAARRAASAQVQQAQTALAQATLEAGRASKLAQDNFISAAARDQAALSRQAAQQALTAAQAGQGVADFSLAEARAALARAEPSGGSSPTGRWELRSPVDGQVLKLHLDSAAPVTVGQPLLDIGNTAGLEAVIDVLSGEVRQIQPGAPVQLSLGSGAAPMVGQVTRIEPVAFTKVSALGIEEQRVNVIVDLVQSSPEVQRLGDGFRVDARITLFRQANALLVPTAALVRDGDKWRVFVVEAGRARARSVQLQDRNSELAWLKDGLRDGETVLMYPGSMVADGQAVRVRQP